MKKNLKNEFGKADEVEQLPKWSRGFFFILLRFIIFKNRHFLANKFLVQVVV